MHLYECFMKHSTWYKGTVGGSTPVGILWHDTGAGNPYIKRYVQPYKGENANYDEMMKLLGKNQYGNDWNHSDREAGVHAFIGKLADESIATVQTGTFDMYPWGCGGGSLGSCNGYVKEQGKTTWIKKHFIQFEICDDGYKDKAYFEKVYKEAIEFTAMLCKQYNFNPKGTVKFAGVDVPVITCHYDAYHMKLGSNHGDVITWFKKMGKTMDDVRNDVAALLAEQQKPKEEPKPTSPTNESANTSEKIEVGDVVKIIGKTYYSGKTVPEWALKLNWIVESINKKGDRIVLDKSQDGKHIGFCSPFKPEALKVVKNAKPWVPAVGDTVQYNGSIHYTNPNALIPKICKKGLATITKISGLGTSKHPYHLKYVNGKGSTVYGWVNSGSFVKS